MTTTNVLRAINYYHNVLIPIHYYNKVLILINYYNNNVWNGTPEHITALQSITQFKKAYKLILLNTYTCKHCS